MLLSDVIAELRSLNQPVPRPPRLPTEGEVISVESRLGVAFPADYRHFLLHGSDVVFGTLEPAVVTPDAGRLDLVNIATDAWDKMELPGTLLPFCEDNGDYYCLERNGRVVYWSHNGTTDESWPDLAHWIKQVWIEGG